MHSNDIAKRMAESKRLIREGEALVGQMAELSEIAKQILTSSSMALSLTPAKRRHGALRKIYV
jgi:hypothetical protein